MTDINANPITIYHNPHCGTSRNTLALIRHAGLEPRIVPYLEQPLNRAELVALLAALGTPVREAMRAKEAVYKALELDHPKWRDDELIDAMLTHPILLNRPIVATPQGTRLCRPSEAVLDLLPGTPLAPFSKEDGEVVINDAGQRVT